MFLCLVCDDNDDDLVVWLISTRSDFKLASCGNWMYHLHLSYFYFGVGI